MMVHMPLPIWNSSLGARKIRERRKQKGNENEQRAEIITEMMTEGRTVGLGRQGHQRNQHRDQGAANNPELVVETWQYLVQ